MGPIVRILTHNLLVFSVLKNVSRKIHSYTPKFASNILKKKKKGDHYASKCGNTPLVKYAFVKYAELCCKSKTQTITA